MAQNTLGRNITFPIYYDDNGTRRSFHDLVLKKATVESVVMSLGDKVTGDVYYRDNSLTFTMQEYILVDDVKYYIVNPPTIVREGMVSDNSQLKGMTKYSFVFYHPMYKLGNFPFTDIAVTNDEEVYLSQNKTFYWIGTLFDFIAKLNANLANSEWVVISNITQQSDMYEKAQKQSDVLNFDKQFISDALKAAYETWDIPFIITPTTQIVGGVQKKFKIEFGLPVEEIYTTNEQNQQVPFVFNFGKGVGLKNNSRTPRNNKIVTRIIGEGSERNIPYGYPQIRWYGPASAEYTYGDHAGVYTDVDVTVDGVTHHLSKIVSYPIYKGILGGQYVALIKHPFTRKKLMPKEYRETLYNKICYINSNGTFNTNYNPDIEIVDYIDAIGSTYAHEINPASPSAEMHTFEDIKPELLVNQNYGFIECYPINDSDMQRASSWDDTIDDEGNYKQGYFKVKLPQLEFDLYACAAITENMQINMKSGDCLGCTFDVEVDWDDYKNNFYKADGSFDPVIHTTTGDGHRRDGDKYPDSSQGQITIILKKDTETFGTLMPNVYQHPKGESGVGEGDGDNFVVLGISLPDSYIQSAEIKLSFEMELYMKDNNNYYYDYPLKFDEHFLATHTDILSQISNNKKVRFNYGGQEIALYIKQVTVKYGESPLPKYDIVLTDNIEIVLNQIGQAVGEMRAISNTFFVANSDMRRELTRVENRVVDKEKHGDIHRFYYYAGEWEDTALKGNVVTDLEAPFFSYTTLDANNNPVVSYWVFNPQENGLYTWSEMGAPRESTTSNPSAWVEMISEFKYMITQAIFGEYAQFGSAIINGDWLLSTHGKRNGQDSQQYTYFDPQDPMGEISGNFAPNFCVDLLTGQIYAMSGSVGGFAIDDLNLVNTNYDAGVTIQNQHSTKLVVLGSTAIDPKTNRPVPIIAKMIDSGEGIGMPLHNTAIYLEARNATNNYAFHGAGNGVLEGYMQGWKVNQLASNSTTQQLRLRDGAVQAVYRTTVNEGEFYLPRLGEVWETLGILDNQQYTSFCCELVVINQAAVSRNRDDANYYEPRMVKILGETSESRKYWTDLRTYSLSYAQDCLPVILRDNGSRYLFIDNAYSAHFFLTYINGRYIANYIYG